jgi:DNA repair protein RecO
VALERDEGVCVRRWDWSETSQTLWVFARRLGLLRCVAKGAKREHAGFSGGVEPLTRAEFVVSLRAQQRNPQSLATLASWDLVEIFPAVRESARAFSAGLAMIDIIPRVVTDADPHPALYDALLTSIRMLGDDQADVRALLLLAWSALADTGHAPELARDVRTGAILSDTPAYSFSPRLGGLVEDDTRRGHDPVWRVRAETVHVLRALRSGGVPAGTAPAAVERAARLVLLYLKEVFSCEPPAVDAWLRARTATPDATPQDEASRASPARTGTPRTPRATP